MGKNFSNGLLAGVTAATIWMAISLWVGMPTQAAGMWAVIFLVATTLVAAVLASVIGRGARASS